MWRAVVDTKRGKIWANIPTNPEMELVADVEEDAEKYLLWSRTIGQIRSADPDKIAVFGEAMEENFKKMFDSEVKPAYTIKSDRGNPTDL